MPRTAAHEILPLFTQRWSPRAMSGAALDEATLFRLFEAARWAPSSGNSQPWRFAYAIQGREEFARFFECLDAGNQAWCQRAGALLVVASKMVSERGRPLRNHAFDTGSAWVSLAFQASAMGLVAHGMGGYDVEKAKTAVSLPADHEVQCMVALGYPGDVALLPEKDRAREMPNDRQPVERFAARGRIVAPPSVAG